MKLSISINAPEDADGDSCKLPCFNYEKISEVLESELTKIYPDSKNYESVEISLTFMSPEAIRELNKNYRGVDEATDVLSFPLIDENEPVGIPELPVLALGDIVICPEEVKRLHQELNLSEGIFLMISHSFLHLLGFDHDTEEKEKIMWQKQDEIKNKILFALALKEEN